METIPEKEDLQNVVIVFQTRINVLVSRNLRTFTSCANVRRYRSEIRRKKVLTL